MENTLQNSTDITQVIINTINTIFGNLFSSIDNNLYDVLDKVTFISADILNDSNFSKIFGSSASNGILLISNSLLLGFLLYYAIRYLMAHLTFSQAELPSKFLVKLLLCGIFMNFSFYCLEIFLELNNNISLAICSIGENLFHKKACFAELINTINTQMSIDTATLNLFSLDGLIKSVLSVSLLSLVFSYSLRYIFVKVFILLAPFAILSLCLQNTNWFFKAWFRNLFSLLFLQIIVSLVLVILFSMDYSSSNLFVKFIYVGGIYALIRANSFIREFIGGVSTQVTQTVKNLF